MEDQRRKKLGRKVNLDDESLALVNRSVKELRGESCKLTNSSLVSKVLCVFFEKYFEKERDNIQSHFFDEKSYLQKIITSSKDKNELSTSLRGFLKKVDSKSKRKSENFVNQQ